MRIAFWISMILIFCAYIGYPLLLRIEAALRPRPISSAAIDPTVSIILAVRNEEANLVSKLENLKQTNYPKNRLEVVAVSDGSTDETNRILSQELGFVRPIILERAQGKAFAVNRAVEQATGDILVFNDVRQSLDPTAVAELVSCFADPAVGAVSGELVLLTESGEVSTTGLGLYWKIEKAVRKAESISGSVVGVTGAIYAIRRELFIEMPKGTILDDVFVPMQVARLGKRVILNPLAIAYDKVLSQKNREFKRKVRTLTGNYQLLRLAPWLLTPRNPLLFRFICHKLLRLAVPFLLILLFLSSAVLPHSVYKCFFWCQVAFYTAAGLGACVPECKRFLLIGVANTFVMLNLAAALAFYNFIRGRDAVWA